MTLSQRNVTAAPANDRCTGAVVIEGAGPFPYLTPVVDILTATKQDDPPPPGAFYPPLVIRGVWFRFTPAVSASYTLATCSGPGATATTADTVMAIYTSAAGCNGPFVPDGDADDQSCVPQASLTRQLLADTTYYLLVWKFCENCEEDFLNDVQVQVTATLPPPNDTCASAVPVSLNIPTMGTTVGARDNYQLANTNGFGGINQTPSTAPGRDVVYSFTAPETGDYSFKVTGYVLQDLVLYVAPACPPGNGILANVLGAANRSQVNSSEEVLCLPLAPGQEVFVFVDDNTGGNAGTEFILEVTHCVREPEPNDTTIDAKPLACGVEGSIFPLGDRDFFALGTYPAGWRAFALVDGEAAGNADLDLRLTTYSDTVEFDDDNNDVSFGGASPNLSGTPLTGERSFLFVNYNDFVPRESEPYRLYAVVQPPAASASLESEPNNSTDQANSAEPNYFRGTLDGSADTDVYAFSVAEGDLVFLGLDCDPYRTNAPINAQLELLDASGALLVGVNDSDFSSSGGTNVSTGTLMGRTPSALGEALVYRSPVEGTFFARVSISLVSAGSIGAGNYLLSISRNCLIGSDGLNHAPALSNAVITPQVIVGAPATLTGTIWELDAIDAPTLLVNWGDGSTNQFEYSPGRTDFSETHVFTAANTNFNVIVSVRDQSGAGNGSITVPVRVRPFIQPARFLSIEWLPNSRVRLELQGTPQIEYRIEMRDTTNAWSLLGVRTADAAGRFTIDDLSPVDSARFYRAVGE